MATPLLSRLCRYSHHFWCFGAQLMNVQTPASQLIWRRSKAVRAAAILVIVAGSMLNVRASSPGHRALLSVDLLNHEARKTSSRVRVIVHGTPDQVQALADRHHVEVLRFLGDSAVVSASSADITNLARDLSIDHLSGDSMVRPSMTISNAST